MRKVAQNIVATYDTQSTISGFIANVVWPAHLDDEDKLHIIWYVIDIMYGKMLAS